MLRRRRLAYLRTNSFAHISWNQVARHRHTDRAPSIYLSRGRRREGSRDPCRQPFVSQKDDRGKESSLKQRMPSTALTMGLMPTERTQPCVEIGMGARACCAISDGFAFGLALARMLKFVTLLVVLALALFGALLAVGANSFAASISRRCVRAAVCLLVAPPSVLAVAAASANAFVHWVNYGNTRRLESRRMVSRRGGCSLSRHYRTAERWSP